MHSLVISYARESALLIFMNVWNGALESHIPDGRTTISEGRALLLNSAIR